ncbi:cryptochrome/photolyase family protein [Chiayiivirga flava]|uniref:Deoxyribodipyrimidine photo-lyase n=1 Tax=Chiayiivirga flava TaxID=659595 RepID=A0A7W8FY43_9GAMM|nr:deoxyribodipyrimidine photo-lyase [Chiayiivirga flava]MBB5206706.1 deoxyribodipyrimidine photo-lyase [Chiayiivirga flava]
MTTALLWFRRDLRLDDNPALQAALDAGHRIVPVYVHAPDEEAPWMPGAASRAWLAASLRALSAALRERGSMLVLRRGPTERALETLIEETGASAVYWNRLYEPAVIARDAALKTHFKQRGIDAHSHNAALLFEPWEIETGQGTPYRVFTPFWRNARARLRDGAPPAAPARLPAVPHLASETVDALLPAPRPRWDRPMLADWRPGAAGAAEMLEVFLDDAVAHYKTQRDLPDRVGTSRLSPHLHFGEISPRRLVAAIQGRTWPAAVEPHVETWLKELGWREFSHHLLYHFPASTDANLNPRFDDFPWAPRDNDALEAWCRGRTGVPIVDAGMRELWATGFMHNRVRMLTASFLTKNLRQHWIHGARWFWDTLVDADLANNTQGWQWTAGTGADAAPYFRIFNPVTQARRFDPDVRYVRRWLPELDALPDAAVFAPWEHADAARLAPDYPAQPIVDLAQSRDAALAAHDRIKTAR